MMSMITLARTTIAIALFTMQATPENRTGQGV
jgi:hypothetical protein